MSDMSHYRQCVQQASDEEAASILASQRATNLDGMNRAESRLYRMQEKVLESAKWKKMVQRVDFGKEIAPYKLVPIKLNGRLKRYNGLACWDHIEVSKDFYRAATPKRLMRLMKHEMVHILLQQNKACDGHGPLYKTCCHVLGLANPNAKESGWNYQHICTECGWWLKSMKRSHKVAHTCRGQLKFLVTRAEYQKLARIAKIGSKVCAVNIEAYQVMEVKKVKPNLRMREGSA
jgi:hypothetical protein